MFEQKRKSLLPTMKAVWRTQLLPPVLHFIDDPTLVEENFGDLWSRYDVIVFFPIAAYEYPLSRKLSHVYLRI